MDNGLIFPYPLALKVTENKRYCVLTEMYVETTVEVVIVHQGFGCGDNISDDLPRKASQAARTVNHTGSWDENSKVLERFMAKELGKMGP